MTTQKEKGAQKISKKVLKRCIKEGWIELTPKGYVITVKGWKEAPVFLIGSSDILF